MWVKFKKDFFHRNRYHHHHSVLPKGRSHTRISSTKTAVPPEGRSSTANSGTKVAVLLGMSRYGSFPLLSASHSLTALSECSALGQASRCKIRHQGCSSAQRQVFHSKLRNQVLLGINRCGSLALLTETPLSLSSSSSSQCSAQGQVTHSKPKHQGCSSAQRQVLHRRLRNQG